jgi:small basic protein (TIGR04137 family)
MDRSFKVSGALARHRNVLKRAERIEILQQEERWDPEEDSILGLPKVAHRKARAGKKAGDEEEAAAEETAAVTTAEPAAESEKTEEKK